MTAHLRPIPSAAPNPLRETVALAFLAAAVLLIYCPRGLFRGERLVGSDYAELHYYRIIYAQQALFSDRPHLPAWHSRELLGAPFWANVQNFPFIPTRLALLGLSPSHIFAVGVNLAAVLSAWGAYLYCRRVGLNIAGAMLAGWTFACAGYFASRVPVGHLPLLEAYPALPLLLWLCERVMQLPCDSRRMSLRLAALALVVTSTSLAGHPQIPFYALLTTGLYAVYRCRVAPVLPACPEVRASPRHLWLLLGTMAAGILLAGFALWPFALLVGRSTRVLALEQAANNIAFPYGRLGAFVLPWKDGWPPAVMRFPAVPLKYPTQAYFWDTVCYVGLVPLAAAALLAAGAWRRRRMPSAPWPFFAVVGAAALVIALPAVQRVMSLIPGTFLRSPARQVYLTTFALSVGAGAAIHHLVSRRARWATAAAAVAAGFHAADLWLHDRCFIIALPTWSAVPAALEQRIAREIGDGRVVIDVDIPTDLNRRLDDAGFFDSVMLARPYRALMDLAGKPPRINIQYFEGSTLNVRALRACAVRYVLTWKKRDDLPPLDAADRIYAYEVPGSSPRAAFFPLSRTLFLSESEIHKRLRDPQHDTRSVLMLPGENPAAAAATTSPGADAPAAALACRRPSPDEIVVDVAAPAAGFVRIIEAWDPGWRATVDGAPAVVLAADDFALAVPVREGSRQVRLAYHTPGAVAGRIISLVGAMALAAVLAASRRCPPRASAPGMS